MTVSDHGHDDGAWQIDENFQLATLEGWVNDTRVSIDKRLDAALQVIHILRRRLDLVRYGDRRHLIQFNDVGYVIQHPMACRPNLFACAFNHATRSYLDRCDDSDVESVGHGTYECTLDDDGRLVIGTLVMI